MKKIISLIIACLLIMSVACSLISCDNDDDCPACGGTGYYQKKDCPLC